MADKIHHIIAAGLEHGKYYRVYVTQVNKNGIESARSIPSLIRVGDVEAPPVPVLSVDTSEFSNGCYADENGTITCSLKWTESNCDDLDRYVVYRWNTLETYTGDGEYSANIVTNATRQYPMTSGTLSTEITGLATGTNVYLGIQAIDLSRNASKVYVVKVDAEDLTQLNQPTSPITVEAYGIWALRVSTPCPQFSNIKYVVFYRDGWKQLSPVIFHKGLDAELVDALDVLDGLTHFYTYLYITKDGRNSPMSAPSASVTAKPIDTSYIDSTVIEDLKRAWQTDDISSTKALLAAASKQAAQVQELYKQLKDVTEDYTKLYNNFTLAANEIKLLSAKVESQGDTLSAYGTAIEQNAKNITLRATKGDIDSATGQLRSGLVSMINVQADRISSVVANTSQNTSAITQLANQMQLKVNSGDLSSQINLAIQNGISVAYIKASRIVLDGQMLLEGNARICGKLYSNDMALIDSSTNTIIWGAGSGTIRPTVTDLSWPDWMYLAAIKPIADRGYHSVTYWYMTPRPPVNFNGYCTVSATVVVTIGVGFHSGDYHDDAWQYQRGSMYFGLNTSADGEFQSTSGHPVVNPGGDGWTRTLIDADRHIEAMEYKQITLKYEGTLRIGEQVQMKLWFRSDEIPHCGDWLYTHAASCHIEVI